MLTRKMKKIILLGLVVFAIITLSEVYGGNTYTVHDTNELYDAQHGRPPYPPLEDGDTIILEPGTYTSITLDPWCAPIDPPEGKHITYIGSGIGATILYGGKVSAHESAYMPCVNLDPGNSADVCNLTVLCGYIADEVSCNEVCDYLYPGFDEAGIVCKDANLIMRDCLVTGGDMTECYCGPSGYNDKWIGDTSGIYCEDSSLLIENCTISIARLVPEELYRAKSPIKIKGSSSNVTVINSNISGNKPKDMEDYLIGAAIKLENGGNLTVENCTFLGNKGRAVKAGAGTGDVTITNNCIIDGGNIAPGLLFANSGKIEITGSTIRNCYSSAYNPYSCAGAGIYISSSLANILIDNCNFTDNTTDSTEGGAININGCASGTINNCIISRNEAIDSYGGGISLGSDAPNVAISSCTISDNNAIGGGGIYNYSNGITTVTHCRVTGNKALQQGAEGGGILSANGDIDIINCMITENEADTEHGGEGGGIWVENTNKLNILNSTVADNNAYVYGGAKFDIIYASADIYNCIFWGNRGYTSDPELNKWQIRNASYDHTSVSHCDIEHSKSVLYDLGYGEGTKEYIVDLNFDLYPYSQEWPDESRILGSDLGGNKDEDPLFALDYHLSTASLSCIDQGDDGLVPPDEFDLDGDGDTEEDIPYDIDTQPRVMGLWGLVDIGADEYGEEEPQDRVYNINQENWYNYIQPAINEAITGDEIVAYPSTYYENINFMGKDITVRSTNPNSWGTVETTIIDGSGNPSSPTVQFAGGEGPNAILKGFTVEKGSSGIKCYCSHPTISNCIIEENSNCGIDYSSAPAPPPGLTVKDNIIRYNAHGIMADSGGTFEENQIYGNATGIYGVNMTAAVSNNHIYDNDKGIYARYTTGPIERNHIYDNNKGIHLLDYSSAAVRNNLICGNDYGIEAETGSPVTISNNTVVNNASYGIAGSGSSTIYNCIAWNNGDDLYDCSATYSCIQDGDSGTGNISVDPCFIDSDCHLKSNSPCINAGDEGVNYDGQTDIDGDTRVIGPRVDMGADEYGRVYNITQEIWYNNIQDAIISASSDDVIVVYPGTYYENINFADLTIRSIDPNDPCVAAATIIDGGGCYITVDIGHDAVLNGFTVTGGTWAGIRCYCSASPTINNCIIEDNSIYGIYHSSPSYVPSLIVKNSIIRHNGYGSSDGSGIWTDSGAITIKENQIYDNRRGIYAYVDSSPTIRNNQIYNNNYGSGSAGIYLYYCTATIEGNRIYDNERGIYSPPYAHSTETIERNRIYNNGVGIYNDAESYGTIRNNFIYGNGCGITAFSSIIISNNTIAKNTEQGINDIFGVATIYNCIIWDNGEDLIGDATYSCISNCEFAGGEGNICGDANDPCFIDADVNNYHLTENSPCINIGDPCGNYTGQTDIDGEPRVLIGRVDIGADETYYSGEQGTGGCSWPPIDPNLTNWWKLDETSGETAYDSAGDSDGTFNGDDPCWTDGLIGGAVDFDGVNDYFSVSSLNTEYSNGSVFTVAGWFKTDQSTGIQTIVGQWSQSWEAGQEYFGWQVLVENNKIKARFAYNGITITDITGTSDVNDGQWHQFAMVHNGTSVAVYVDGQPENSGTANFSVYNTKFRIGDGSYVFGYPPTLKGGPFNGIIDDVMIFDKVLSAGEVEQLYDEGLEE